METQRRSNAHWGEKWSSANEIKVFRTILESRESIGPKALKPHVNV